MSINWIHSVPYSQRILLLAVIIGLIASGFYTMVWQPQTVEIEILERNIRDIQQEIILQAKRRSEYPQIDAQIQRIGATGYFTDTMGESKINPHRFRRDVMKIANSFGLTLTLWQPSHIELDEANQLSHLLIRGRFEGGYHQIAQSLAAILQLSWVLEVKQIRLNATDNVANEKRSLVADFQLASISDSPSREWSEVGQTQGDGV